MGRKKSRTRQWVTTKIPRALADRAKRLIKEESGYPSLLSFVSDAVRRRLEQLETWPKQTKEVPA